MSQTVRAPHSFGITRSDIFIITFLPSPLWTKPLSLPIHFRGGRKRTGEGEGFNEEEEKREQKEDRAGRTKRELGKRK